MGNRHDGEIRSANIWKQPDPLELGVKSVLQTSVHILYMIQLQSSQVTRRLFAIRNHFTSSVLRPRISSSSWKHYSASWSLLWSPFKNRTDSLNEHKPLTHRWLKCSDYCNRSAVSFHCPHLLCTRLELLLCIGVETWNNGARSVRVQADLPAALIPDQWPVSADRLRSLYS